MRGQPTIVLCYEWITTREPDDGPDVRRSRLVAVTGENPNWIFGDTVAGPTNEPELDRTLKMRVLDRTATVTIDGRPGFRSGEEGDLRCPHRYWTCCNECLEACPSLVDVDGLVFVESEISGQVAVDQG